MNTDIGLDILPRSPPGRAVYARQLWEVVEEGRQERRKEEEEKVRCQEQEALSYSLSLVALSHLATFSRALALQEQGRGDCVPCLYRRQQEVQGVLEVEGPASYLSLTLAKGAKGYLGWQQEQEHQYMDCVQCPV